jgi:hypothetical protein
MANRLSDQETLEFQFQGTPIDPVKVDSDARELRTQLLDAIQADAEAEVIRQQKRCEYWPDLPNCQKMIPPPLTMEEYDQTIEDFYGANKKFDELLEFGDMEQGVLIDPVDDFFPVEFQEPLSYALVPTLVIGFVIAALLLFLRDGIRRLLGRPKQRTGRWGIF